MPFRRCQVLAAALLLAAGTATAGPVEVAETVVDKVTGVAVKVEGAVQRGARAAAGGVERGTQAAGRAVSKVAAKVGLAQGGGTEAAERERTRQAP